MPLPFLPPTFNYPSLASLPIHKQALLSPLLAASTSHMLAAAAAVRNNNKSTETEPPLQKPLVNHPQFSLDFLAEHKALLERFREAAACSATASPHLASEKGSPVLAQDEDGAEGSLKPNQNSKVSPIDLRKRSFSGEDQGSEAKKSRRERRGSNCTNTSTSSSSVSMGSDIIPNLSDTDPEDEGQRNNNTDAHDDDDQAPEDKKVGHRRSKRSQEESPLDLTRV